MKLEDLYIKQIPVGQMMNFAYLVGDKSTGEAAIIDPGWEGDRLVEVAKKDGLKIAKILATHTHFDHVGEVPSLVSKLDVPVYVHVDEAAGLSNVSNVKTISDGDQIGVGGLNIQVLHTPGHSKGSVCFLIDSLVFTGDTLFINNIGRTDLEGSDPEKMFSSLTKLRQLPDGVVVYPGHNYGPSPVATMGEQKKTNPYLKSTSVSDFFRIA
jgi:glyoxylase-like metal-dependent hydrolase (beta-lactamase superfamily II)